MAVPRARVPRARRHLAGRRGRDRRPRRQPGGAARRRRRHRGDRRRHVRTRHPVATGPARRSRRRRRRPADPLPAARSPTLGATDDELHRLRAAFAVAVDALDRAAPRRPADHRLPSARRRRLRIPSGRWPSCGRVAGDDRSFTAPPLPRHRRRLGPLRRPGRHADGRHGDRGGQRVDGQRVDGGRRRLVRRRPGLLRPPRPRPDDASASCSAPIRPASRSGRTRRRTCSPSAVPLVGCCGPAIASSARPSTTTATSPRGGSPPRRPAPSTCSPRSPPTPATSSPTT